MTVATDNFTTDPSTRWTSIGTSSYAWDSGDAEFDVDTTSADPHIFQYTSSGTGSIESEAQVTFRMGDNSGFQDRVAAAMVRGASAAATGYILFPNIAGYFAMSRMVAGTEEEIDYSSPGGSPGYISESYAFTYSQFYTIRLAVSGTAGSNCVISVWIQSHGASKPTDPGWIGVDGSPDFTYTDSEATRLDDSGNTICGIAGRNAAEDFDTRHCFYKQRAIADRGASSSSTGRMMLAGSSAGRIGGEIDLSQSLNGALQ